MNKVAYQKARILIVDDEKDICDILFRVLEHEGFMPIVAHNGETALEMVQLGIPELMLLDLKMTGMDGMEVLRKSKEIAPDLPILMITAWGGIDGAVRAVKEGAHDYLAKPLDKGLLLKKIRGALTERIPKRPKVDFREDQAGFLSDLRETMGPSEAMARVVSEISMVAPSNFSVVIQGETGTGKELVAGAIHKASLRGQAPFVPVDCGAIPETLFESELFGYEKGAFTGATSERLGKFEMAQGGTLFLDEISNMPLMSQIKLLRAIQEKSFFKVGGTKAVNVDVRLITATNVNLNIAVRSATFSRDLFYRLSEFTITIPPLRERREDILHIAKKIVDATNTELSKHVRGFSEEASSAMLNEKWPGNIRQLRSAVRRAVLQATDLIEPSHLALEDYPEMRALPDMKPVESSAWEGLSLKEIVRRNTVELERTILLQALKKTGGNKAKAARLLKIDYSTIHAKLKQYGIKVDEQDADQS
jgi:DNA-binding NtrC family response regulator